MFSANTSQVSSDALYIEDVFSTYIYLGNAVDGVGTQTINNGINLSTNGGLVWIKNLNGTSISTDVSHQLHDSARGVTNSLSTNLGNAQANQTTGGVTSFNSNGYSIGDYPGYNESDYTYISWTFRKAAKFFDVQTKSHTNGAVSTVDLSALGTVGAVVVKSTGTSTWWVWHRSLAAGNNLFLDSNLGPTTTNAFLSVSGTTLNMASGMATGTYVVYGWAHNAGGFGPNLSDNAISCGSFNLAGASIAAVDVGFEPQFVLVKGPMFTDWVIFDTIRGLPNSRSNNGGPIVRPNSSVQEQYIGTTNGLTSNGFFINEGSIFGSGDYVYIAIRRGLMKKPTVGTNVFEPATGIGNDTSLAPTNFPVDFVWEASRSGSTSNTLSGSRVQQNRGLRTSSVIGDFNAINYQAWRFMNGVKTSAGLPATLVFWCFRRAWNFFDFVFYTGTGSNLTVNHDLNAIPELVIVKRADASSSLGWYVWSSNASSGSGSGKALLNSTAQYGASDTMFTSAPTSSSMTFSSGVADTNANEGSYVALLFATCPGVSKVGSYTGTGTTLQINCGFTGGARFVLIKRTDSTGDWYVWDSARGIVAGNDPYLLMNSTAAEVTGTDYVDTYSAGFEISSTAPAAINANGGLFIYLAIA